MDLFEIYKAFVIRFTEGNRLDLLEAYKSASEGAATGTEGLVMELGFFKLLKNNDPDGYRLIEDIFNELRKYCDSIGIKEMEKTHSTIYGEPPDLAERNKLRDPFIARWRSNEREDLVQKYIHCLEAPKGMMSDVIGLMNTIRFLKELKANDTKGFEMIKDLEEEFMRQASFIVHIQFLYE